MDNDRYELIRARAYEIWEEEGRPAGRESEHWRQAELEFEEASAENAGPQGERVVRNTAGDDPESPAAATLKRTRRRKESGG